MRMTHTGTHFVDQSVNIQLPSAEDGEGFLQNIWFQNMSVVEQF